MTLDEKIENGELSRKAGKEVSEYLKKHKCSLDEAIDRLGLKQCIANLSDLEKFFNDSNILNISKSNTFNELFIEIMKQSRGSFSPNLVTEFLNKKGYKNEN